MTHHASPIVVAVGASAGGLEAFEHLMRAVPRSLGVAWVLVQHLDPTHESAMAGLLDRRTSMPVREATQGGLIRPDHVYVIPPNREMTVDQGRLALVERPTRRGGATSIDQLFRSLAGARGRGAVGVVLSGTGSDGTLGLRAIKAAGGLTIAQDPASAAYPAMPRSAIAARVADFVLRPDEMPAAIADFIRHPYVAGSEPAAADRTGAGDDAETRPAVGSTPAEDRAQPASTLLEQVLDLLRESLGLDLSVYKESTLYRRVCRRMGLVHDTELADYVERLRADRSELRQLARDMHINVTEFFRDPQAFEALRRVAVPAIFEAAARRDEEDRTVRAWVPGCATGEEAFTVAMLLLEERESRSDDPGIPVHVFASDVDEDAIATARDAAFPESAFTGLDEDRRDRWFRTVDASGLGRVAPEVRDIVSFACHDVLADPPFSRLDLVSCRNLLIYLRKQAQETALASFHFALRPHGYLLLGPSESLGHSARSFRVIDPTWRLFQRLDGHHGPYRRPLLAPRTGRPLRPVSVGGRPTPSSAEIDELAALRAVADASMPPSVLVNDRYEILYVQGDLIDVLDLPQGLGTLPLLDMLRDEARTRVRAAVYRASRGRETVSTTGRITGRDGASRLYRVDVSPCTSRELGEDLLVVSFHLEDAAGDQDAEPGPDAIDAELDREVQALRDDLRSTVEELERANEQLRASNEEAMTMNEELQSTNEELETQSEELRSVNEELTTVNAQLKEKIDEVQEANEDVTNLLNSTRLPAVFLDRAFRIRRYTPEAYRILNVIETDVGRPIHDLSWAASDETMLEDARAVMEGLAPVEKEIREEDGEWYLRRILPYRTSDDRIAGVVITFSQVTRLKRLTAALAGERQQQAAVAGLGLRALRMHDPGELGRYAVRLVADAIGSPYVAILERTSEGMRLDAAVGWDEALVGSVVAPDAPSTEPGHALRHPGPVVVADHERETRFTAIDALRERGVRSAIAVAVHGRDGRSNGVLMVHAEEPEAFGPQHAAFLQQIANVLSGTGQRLAVERQLAIGEERLRLASEATEDALWDFDLVADRVWWNDAYARRFGRPRDTDDSWRWWTERIHEEDRDEIIRSLRTALSTGASSWQAEYRFLDADGRHVPIWDRAIIARDDSGVATRVVGAMTDLTEQRAREQEIETGRRKLQSILDNAPVAIFAKDAEGRFVLSNRAHAQILGVDVEDVIGRRDEDFAGSRARAEAYRVRDREAWTADRAVRTEEPVEVDGETRSFLSLKFPLVDGQGRTYAVCGIAADITDRKRDEEHLRNVMAELNHRVKNTLASIEAIAMVTSRGAESMEEFLASFGARLRAMSAAHGILTRTEWRGASLREVLTSEVMPRVAGSEQVELDGPDVSLRPRVVLALHMVVHELATNAVKYGSLSRPGGRVRIRWDLEQPTDDAPWVRILWTEEDGPAVEPPASEGFGHRLFRQLVEYDLGGTADVRFAPTGLEAELRFPREAGTPARGRPPSSDDADGTEVLLVEDSGAIAATLARSLADRGFRVQGPAGSLEAARALVDRRPPAAALLDVDLDGQRVYPLARRLVGDGVPCAFLSGYDVGDVPEELRSVPLFNKPVRLEDVTTWLEQVLAPSARRD